ncbi:MAG: folate hydrolase [Phenylobacterium sp.]|uniref:transferrin receptor-like dimerization domain-containing protein n=1 Tax=Phenylobacterium sp. TaxID=1871053 RepID=UPI0026116EA1|nr:transferrin receptor-like dimerization domain-containing protein [Phenylobacterium sp.]MDB5497973.1 folate hydrolase [Phenylobacterium sp.]
MNRHTTLAALLSACALGAVSAAWAAPPPTMDSRALEAKFDAQIDPAEMGGWLKLLAAEPNHVGSAHDKTNAEWIAAQLKSWGWNARIETFDVLYPTPISESLELVGGAGAPFKATLTEPPVAGDAATNTKDALPAYVAFQGDGDVTAPLVYVNYGMPDDYLALERMGISVKGKIAIARYGGGWRGLKPKLAQDHGAVGAIIYSDPKDDGYATEDVYPKGPARPPHGFQRGSVADMTLYPGDPLTPGVGSTKDAKRLDRSQAQTILKIPCLPISYADAQVLLASLDGPVAPANWRGSLPITYHVGGGAAGGRVRLAVKSDWSTKTLYDVVGELKGRDAPNEWIVRGNHHDGWVMGASDPLSGQIALLAEAKALGGLVKAGWKPGRTIVYTSWDGEEPMLLGSTEWAETHADELKAKALVYINSDGNGRGFFGAEGSHAFQHFVNQVSADVKDPETGVSVRDRLRARLEVLAADPGANEQARATGKIAADPAKDLPIAPLGSGSDYSAFLQHLGLASINVGYGGEGDSGGVYHSLYDDYEHHSRFVDPGFVYDATLAKTVGRMVIRLADADLPVQRYGDFADTVGRYLDEVKKLAETTRDQAATQKKLLASNAYGLAADPTIPHAAPTALGQSPATNFAALDVAVAKLKASSAAFDTALAAKGAGLSKPQKARLGAAVRPLDQSLLRPEGLPGRPWYMNMVYAPGRFTGYGAKTLPGVREAIEERRFDDAQKYVGVTAQALEAYAANLDKATAIVNGG